MKKLLLLLLCVPLMFSCGEDNDKKRKKEKEKDIEGYWKVTFPGKDNPSLIFHFAEDGFFCSDVNIGSSCRDNRDKINNCDDCMSDNNWKYTNDEETQISIKAGKRKKTQRLMEWDIEKETENRYILSGGYILERTSLKEIKKYGNRMWNEKDPKEQYDEEEEINTESYVESEGESYMYGVINDPDGYTNVREDKSSKSKIVFKVYESEEFKIIDNTDNNWWMIEYNKKQGYIYKDKIDIFKKHH